MSLTLHTEDPGTYEIDSTECDLIQADEPQEEATQNETIQPDPELAPATQRISDDEDFCIRIWNAEMRCRGREAVVEDLKEQLKEAKASLDSAISALRKLANEARQPMPLFDTSQPVESAPAAESEAVATEAATDDEAWRKKDFIEFIQGVGIEGLGKKKLEALAEVVPTFGCFETLREMASLENVHLCKKLPAGFGEKVTDQIEEAYLVSAVNAYVAEKEEDEWSEAYDDGLEYKDVDVDLDSL